MRKILQLKAKTINKATEYRLKINEMNQVKIKANFK